MVATRRAGYSCSIHPPTLFTPLNQRQSLQGVPRRTILVYCKHRLLSPLFGTGAEGYSFDGDGIRSLRRIEALRTVCGDDFTGIRIILDLTRELERLQAGPSRTGVFRST